MANPIFTKIVKSGTLIDPIGIGRATATKSTVSSAATSFAQLLSARQQAKASTTTSRTTQTATNSTNFFTSVPVLPSLGEITLRQSNPTSVSAVENSNAIIADSSTTEGTTATSATTSMNSNAIIADCSTAEGTTTTSVTASVNSNAIIADSSTTEGTTVTDETTSVSSDAIITNSSTTEGTTATTTAENTTSAKAASAPDFDAIMQTIFRHEGSRYVGSDAGGESSKYGILQSTAKENGYVGDIRNITQDQAKEVYRKIWNKSGAAQMSSDLSLVYFDSYINHPASAKRFLAQSGGDIDTILQLRETRYQELAATKPERFGRYLKGWTNRITSLRTAVGAQPVVAETGDTSTSDA